MAQKKAGKQPSNLKTFYWLLGLLAVAGIAAIAWIVLQGRAGDAALEPVDIPSAQDPQTLVAKAEGVTIGNDGAPVKMLVFSDYQCPYCGEFAAQIEPVLRKEFVDSGKLQFVYYDFPLGGSHRHSFLAARAARCAGDQDKFWQYHDMLFGKQSEWSFEAGVPVREFLTYAEELALDRSSFDSCLKSDKYQDVVSANRLLGERLGVNATPTIFVNGRRIEGRTMLELLNTLRETIKREAQDSHVS